MIRCDYRYDVVITTNAVMACLVTETFASELPEAILHSGKLDHVEIYGQKIAHTLKTFQERIALLASGDLSHRLKKDGPYGLHPSGPRFDQLLVNSLARDPSLIQHLPEELAEEAGECGWRSLRLSLETYLKDASIRVLNPPTEPEFKLRRACFVTLKKNGKLRGCIGTPDPWRDDLAQEIEHNAIAAGMEKIQSLEKFDS